MILMNKKKTKCITFQLGYLWHYVKEIDNVEKLLIMTEALTNIAFNLDIDWDAVQEVEKQYAVWTAYQSGDL